MSSWCQDYRVTSNYLYIYLDIYILYMQIKLYIYIAQTAPDGPCYASCPSPFTVSTPPRAGRSPLWWGWSGRARLPCGGQLMMTSSGVCPCEFCGGNMPPEIFELNTLWWVNGYNLYIYIYIVDLRCWALNLDAGNSILCVLCIFMCICCSTCWVKRCHW